MHKEHSIWQGAHLAPWKDETTSNWYKTISQSPADALIEADACGHIYSSTDLHFSLKPFARV
ncbi:uncharacterized protein N7484_002049 [Penicillium longicatenatum]|uniref:uncharacterized protein n=1 Tax=Penicillium longicatenatum TaxID=1561947 RepID=UPI0025494599|nr:uncharacterized protein N7484_002049 [Penicillium longicatenatum]KAJ5658400.1 hypothetical protein N7484_002049 [Penicillium longicatenatum]